MSAAETVRVLNDAADLIERDGWWKSGMAEGGVHTHCAGLAINRVRSTIDCRLHASAALHSFLGLPDEWGQIPHWNDAQPNGETVINALRDCAYKLSLDCEFV